MHYEKVYKARFIHAANFRSIFQYSNCVLPISVGQKYHSDAKLKSALNLINENFAACTIIIADTLQRHTLMFQSDLSEKEATDQAIFSGQQWLSNHSPFIENILTIPYQIYFWDKWLDSDAYLSQRQLTEHLYHTSQEFKSAVYLTLDFFLTRQMQHSLAEIEIPFSKEESILNYILEECSVMPLWVKENFHFEIYPAKRTPAMATIYDLVVKPYHPNLLRYLQLELRSKMQLAETMSELTN